MVITKEERALLYKEDKKRNNELGADTMIEIVSAFSLEKFFNNLRNFNFGHIYRPGRETKNNKE